MAEITTEQAELLGLDDVDRAACVDEGGSVWLVLRPSMERVDLSGSIPGRERLEATNIKGYLFGAPSAEDLAGAEAWGASKGPIDAVKTRALVAIWRLIGGPTP